MADFYHILDIRKAYMTRRYPLSAFFFEIISFTPNDLENTTALSFSSIQIFPEFLKRRRTFEVWKNWGFQKSPTVES